MAVNRESDVKRYKAILQLSNGINKFFDTYGFCNDEKKHMSENPSQYYWKSFDYEAAPKGFKYLSEDDKSSAARYGSKLFESLQRMRTQTKNVPVPHSVISKAREATDLYAASQLSAAFPSAKWDVASSLGGETSVRKKKTWIDRNLVSLPVTWITKVHDKGISLVRAGDGMRFILDAEERNIDRFSIDNIKVFSVLAMKVKRGVPETENSWVMSYGTSEEPILSVQTNFSRCESLLRRRIKDTVMKELMN